MPAGFPGLPGWRRNEAPGENSTPLSSTDSACLHRHAGTRYCNRGTPWNGETNALEIIEQMAKEGLLFRVRTSKGPLYSQPNFIMGIYEWHVNTIDKETAELADHYYEGMFAHHWKGKKPNSSEWYL